MDTKTNSNKTLYLAILNVILLSLSHSLNNTLMIYISLTLFCILIIFSSKELLLPLILFYLPWNPILKIQPHEFTFFTIIVPIVFLILIIKHKKIDLVIILITILLLVLTSLMRMIYSYSFTFSYIFFFTMFVFIPFYYKTYIDNLSFEKCVYYLSIGIIIACISSQLLMKNSHMLAFIVVDSIEQINLTRLNGFYGDANFYSAQILVAISGLLVMIGKDNKNIIINCLLIVILLFFGFQSVSKMFLFITIILVVIWFFIFMVGKKSISTKIAVIFLITILTIFLIKFNVFEKQISYYLIRFNMVTDTDSLTTGRSVIFGYYFDYFNNNILSIFMGVGLSDALVNSRASHNTLIQMIFQLGLIGSGFVLLWLRLAFKSSNKYFRKNKFNGYTIILFTGCFASWLSLDMLMFDEFFYFILFFLVGKKYLNGNEVAITNYIKKN